jgi:hypothetical protein
MLTSTPTVTGQIKLLAVSIIRHFSMVANPNVPISVGKLCNLTPSGGPLSGGAFGQGYVMVSTDHFRQEIRSRLELATTRGDHDVTIDSGELYKSLSKLPVFGPWMIFCCNAMRGEMTTADSLIFDDAKETLLTVNYRLPRNQRSASPKIK